MEFREQERSDHTGPSLQTLGETPAVLKIVWIWFCTAARRGLLSVGVSLPGRAARNSQFVSLGCRAAIIPLCPLSAAYQPSTKTSLIRKVDIMTLHLGNQKVMFVINFFYSAVLSLWGFCF